MIQQVPEDSKIALAGIYALGMLEDDRPAVLEVLRAHLGLAKTSWAAQQACLTIGTAPAYDLLAEHARGDPQLALTVLCNDPTNTAAFESLKIGLSNLDQRGAQHLLDAAIVNLPEDQVSELVQAAPVATYLREKVLAVEGHIWIIGSKVRACRALKHGKPDTAFLAARKALLNPASLDRERYPYLLVSLDANRALSAFVACVSSEQSAKLLLAIGRAIATLPAADQALTQMLGAADRVARKNACVLAGKRLPTGDLKNALFKASTDSCPQVASAAITALEAISKTTAINKLTEALRKERNRDRQWVLLEILLHQGDPGDVGAPMLPWQRALQTLPEPARRYAYATLEQRRTDTTRT